MSVRGRDLFLLLLLTTGFVYVAFYRAPSSSGNTWSVVAADAETGAVGVAAASCVGVPIDAVAALAPGRGAAAVQADFAIENRNRVYTLLQEGESASQIIAMVTDANLDRAAARRQYGVITLGSDGAEIATFTGSATLPWAGSRSDQAAVVTVQGNLLASEAVVEDSLAAFRANRALPLPDRLMHALEAGSAAGGDLRCNEGGRKQTATAAFILVARGNELPFATATFGASEVGAPATPWLYLSVTEPAGGANPLLALRDDYDAWRREHLPPCEACTTPQVALASNAERATATLTIAEWILLGIAMLTSMTMLIVLWRGRRDSPG